MTFQGFDTFTNNSDVQFFQRPEYLTLNLLIYTSPSNDEIMGTNRNKKGIERRDSE